MLRIGINGVGRIGKAIFRINSEKKGFHVVAINDINPDIKNITYQLNYDTVYGTFDDKFNVEGDNIYNSDYKIKVFHEKHIDNVNWKSEHVNIVIDSSGVLDNVLRAKSCIEKNGLLKVIVTHSPANEVDFTMVLGANEKNLDIKKHHIISSSICDATAIAPVFTIIQREIGIKNGYVTTLHPWLNYQNLMDGPASSWSRPGEIYHHYALGRSAIGNMIPKPTSAIEGTCRVVDGVTEDMIGSFSYRTPTAIIGSADITLFLRRSTTVKEIIKLFEELEKKQRWDIFLNNFEPLVSLDFIKSKYSAIIDHRWTDVIDGNLLKLILWYDNEWGYSTRVVDQVIYITEQIEGRHENRSGDSSKRNIRPSRK